MPRSGANRTFDSSTLPTHPPYADLEWKLTYVGSAEDDKCDQILDTVLVGPVVRGAYKFVFQANPPDVSKIPQEDILGVTVLLVTCSYNNQEFIRVGYYVNNEYADEELKENLKYTLQKNRVTFHTIHFDNIGNSAHTIRTALLMYNDIYC